MDNLRPAPHHSRDMAAPIPSSAETSPAAPGDAKPQPLPGARAALVLLLSINLFNYVDRQVLAAVLPRISEEFPYASKTQLGLLTSAFLVAYMLLSPLFGWLGDRMSRWLLVGVGVIAWSLASGASGLAGSYGVLLATRCLLGIGEAAYGPVAPTLLSDLYPVSIRGRILSWFYLAIPVGSALGYVLGGAVAGWMGWRWAFYVVVPPGIALGLIALFMREPARGAADVATTAAASPAPSAPASAPAPAAKRHASLADYKSLLRNRSYVFNTAGMTAMTFAIGGMGAWLPYYVHTYRGVPDLDRVNLLCGVVMVVAGFLGTLLGGMAGDALRRRHSGSYFIVSAAGLLTGFPLLLLVLVTPFPWAWVFVFLTVFCLFFNTGPSNTILANVTHPSIRATAFALNILVIHALGDVISPPIIGALSDRWNMNVGFFVVSLMFLVGGVLWLMGARYLAGDTAAVEAMTAARA
jgi:MFS family permease